MLTENVKNNTLQVPGDTTAAIEVHKRPSIESIILKNTLNFVKGPSSYPPGVGGVPGLLVSESNVSTFFGIWYPMTRLQIDLI